MGLNDKEISTGSMESISDWQYSNEAFFRLTCGAWANIRHGNAANMPRKRSLWT